MLWSTACKEADGEGTESTRQTGLTPEEDEHIGDSSEQSAAQAAANAHTGSSGL